MIATRDTIVGRYRKLVVRNYDRSEKRGTGRPRRLASVGLSVGVGLCACVRPPAPPHEVEADTADLENPENPGGPGSPTATATSLVARVASIAVGRDNTCAILDDGALRCWGRGEFGVTGLGRSDDIGDDETPASAGDVDLGGSAIRVAIGDERVCAILDGGGVRCWGRSWDTHELIGDDEPASAAPRLDFGRAATEIAVGPVHACVVLDDASVKCWGWHKEGRYGNGRLGVPSHGDLLEEADAPDGPAIDLGFATVEVAVHADGGCALSTTGAVRCWGDRSSERVGYPESTISCTSCDVLESCCIGDHEHPSSVPDLPLGLAARQLSMYAANACVVSVSDSVRCWGSRPRGLGYPSVVDLSRSHDDLPTPALLGDQDWGSAIIEVAVGGRKVCALAHSGEVRCWGHDPLLRPADAPANLERPPADLAPIELGHPAIAIAGAEHVCALLDTGTVRCWGGSDHGQLGYASRHIVGDDESPASMGDVDIAGVVEGATPPRAPDPALLGRLKTLGVTITEIQFDGVLRHHARVDAPSAQLAEIVDGLAELETLRSLDLSANGLHELDAFARLTRLRYLDVSQNPIRNLRPLSRMKALVVLNISETEVRDLRAVETSTELERLRAAGTPLRYVNQVAKMTKLIELDLRRTKVDPDDAVLTTTRRRRPELRIEF